MRKVKSRKSVCFQIGYKENRRFKMVEHVGCAQDPHEPEALRLRANDRLQQLKRQSSLFPQKESTKAKLTNWKVTGYHQVFGSVYDTIDFPENLLRDLVIARIVYPKSKLATIRFLNQTLGVPATRGKVYRFMDTLDKDELTEIAFNFPNFHIRGVKVGKE